MELAHQQRVFFIFDDGNIVILFNGFQKKTQKTPPSEIEKALKIKEDKMKWNGIIRKDFRFAFWAYIKDLVPTIEEGGK